MRPLYRILGILLLLPLLAGVAAERTWTDATGKYRIEAELVAVDAGVVTLKKPDGSTVKVPINKLSPADQQFLSRQAATEGPAEGRMATLQEQAEQKPTAAAAAQLYERFLSAGKPTAAEQAVAEQQLRTWAQRAKEKRVRVGDDWLTLSEAEALEEEAVRLVEEAIRLLEVNSTEQAVDKLRQASRMNPEAIEADFLLGFYYAQFLRDAALARKHFMLCVNRRIDYESTLTPVQRANLVASLNNLALAEVRYRRYGGAMTRWDQAIRIGPISPEIIHNVGRFSHLSTSSPFLKLSSSIARRSSDMYATLAVATGAQRFEEDLGWLYMKFVDESGFSARLQQTRGEQALPSTPANPEKKDLVLFSTGTGFAVAANHIITNRHVVEGGDYLEISAGEGKEPRPATVVAISAEDDLALLKCEGMDIAPLSLSTEVSRLGTEVSALGFPEMTVLGTGLKVTRGTISALPSPKFENALLFDAVINHGNSGGPVCDQTGQVVAVATFSLTLELGNLYGGVPTPRVLQFVQKHVKQVSSEHRQQAKPSWADVVEEVGQGTAQILVYQQASSVNLAQKLAAANHDGNAQETEAWLDIWCMACYGKDLHACPARGCTDGRVKYTVRKAIGVNNATKRPIYRSEFAYRPCGTCRGQGKVACPHCVRGIDTSVLER